MDTVGPTNALPENEKNEKILEVFHSSVYELLEFISGYEANKVSSLESNDDFMHEKLSKINDCLKKIKLIFSAVRSIHILSKNPTDELFSKINLVDETLHRQKKLLADYISKIDDIYLKTQQFLVETPPNQK